ncbi:MAG TPA: molybdopterin-synthase adenylyltransferase MoeB [Candidatus Manganitrophaceae bacterium]|nr:molybdopterin-synthase adenylyltransferase MoeB [Candidatus Manganitrophaceae bacterium]
MAFTEEQLVRYSRHIILTEVGGKGQKKISQAKVLIVGAGGLGSPVALYLAAAGVGTIGIIDADVVDLSNLHRQVVHHTPDLGRAKVLSAQEKMVALNPDVKVIPYHRNLDAENALEIFKEYEYIIDGVDNFPAKFLINDAAFFAQKPLIHGGILRFEGQLLTILPGVSACYRCVFHGPPPAGLVPSCQEAGVIGTLAGLIGTLQGTETLKLILGIGKPLTNRILTYDALRTQFRQISIQKNPNCPLCGDHPTIQKPAVQQQAACETDPMEAVRARSAGN